MNAQQNKELKSEWYARNFFFSFTPEEWSFEDLSNYLRSSSCETVYELACELNQEEFLASWEPFEYYNPSWIADQMETMQEQLSMLYKEVI